LYNCPFLLPVFCWIFIEKRAAILPENIGRNYDEVIEKMIVYKQATEDFYAGKQ